MIETEQTVAIQAPISTVWAYARDISGWASLMPGLQDCVVLDDDDSRWTLKIGVGALVRTVKVFVHVDRWFGPGEVDFIFTLEGDPVNGGGTYRARSVGPNVTEMVLGVRVMGEGPMAPMWEAMGKPLLPKFACTFADQFKIEVEASSIAAGDTHVPLACAEPVRSPIARLVAWLRALFGAKSATQTSSNGETS